MIEKTININGRPFTYMSEEGDPYIFDKMSPDDGAQILKKTRDLFESLQIDFFLIYGTLLGYVREGHIIKGDDDVDIAVFEKDEQRLFSALPILMENGLKLNRLWKKELYTFHTETEVGNRNGYIDVYIVKDFGPSLWRPFAYSIRMTSIPKKHLQYFSFINTEIGNLPIPANPEGLLAWLYGKDWRIPQSKKGRADILARAIWLFPGRMLRKIKKIPRKLRALINN